MIEIYKRMLRMIFCKHEWEERFGYFADDTTNHYCSMDVCKKCGKIKNIIQMD